MLSIRGRASSGIVLIVTLWVLVILAVLALSFAATMHVESRVAANEMDRTRALYAARAGIERAIVSIQTDTSGYAAESSPWASLDSETDKFPFDDERYEVTVSDECGKLNLNAADEELLSKLPELSPEVVASILDWRDQDGSARPEGAEGEYYAKLRPPRACADRPFLTLPELLLVKGVTKEAFYGEAALRSLSLDAPDQGAQEQQATPLADLFTLYGGADDRDATGQDRLNINQADETALSERLGSVLSEEDLQAIVDYRERAGQFTGIGGLLQVPGISREMLQQIADLVTTKSSASQQTASAAPEGQLPNLPEGLGLPEGEGPRQAPEPPGFPPPTVPGPPQPPTPPAPSSPTGGETGTPAADEYRAGIYNLNTASAEVLLTLDGMTEEVVKAILRARQEQPFTSRGDLLRLTEVSDGLFAQIAEQVTVRSSALRIRSVGSVGDGRVRVRLTALLDLKGEEPRVVHIAEG